MFEANTIITIYDTEQENKSELAIYDENYKDENGFDVIVESVVDISSERNNILDSYKINKTEYFYAPPNLKLRYIFEYYRNGICGSECDKELSNLLTGNIVIKWKSKKEFDKEDLFNEVLLSIQKPLNLILENSIKPLGSKRLVKTHKDKININEIYEPDEVEYLKSLGYQINDILFWEDIKLKITEE